MLFHLIIIFFTFFSLNLTAQNIDFYLALLEEGYKVYCIDETCKDIVDERIIFDPAPIEPVCWIDL